MITEQDSNHLAGMLIVHKQELLVLERLKGGYDDVKTLPPSYFDTEHFKYYVGEEEPPYEDWSQ